MEDRINSQFVCCILADTSSDSSKGTSSLQAWRVGVDVNKSVNEDLFIIIIIIII